MQNALSIMATSSANAEEAQFVGANAAGGISIQRRQG